MSATNRCILGDCRDVMRGLIADGVRVQTIITSPPYFGLRDYGVDGQLGLEPSPAAYVAAMVEVFAVARDLLSDDGTLWLNIGDSYASKPNGSVGTSGLQGGLPPHVAVRTAHARRSSRIPNGLKHKDLIGIPWLLAFALRADGWYLRQEIIWHKPNPMPESVIDRCTKAHESLFLLTKSPQYFCDMAAIREPVAASSVTRLSQAVGSQRGGDRVPGKANGAMKAVGGSRSARDSFKRVDSKRLTAIPGQSVGTHRPDRNESEWDVESRNRRSVWTISTTPYQGAHFAVMPEELVEPCVLAGSRPGDIVFDPFMGSGTVAAVAQRLGRRWLGAELNPDYFPLQAARTRQSGLALETA